MITEINRLFYLQRDLQIIKERFSEFKKYIDSNCMFIKAIGLDTRTSIKATKVPFLRIFFPDYNPNATGEQLRIGYLLSEHRTSIFLTLMWGKNNKNNNYEENSFIKSRIKGSHSIKTLKINTGDRGYDKATICSVEYKKGIPNNPEKIKRDLKVFCKIYEDFYNQFVRTVQKPTQQLRR